MSFVSFVALIFYNRQGVTFPTSSKELSNSQLPAHTCRDPVSMALVCYTSGADLSGIRIEDREPSWSEVATPAHSSINSNR